MISLKLLSSRRMSNHISAKRFLSRRFSTAPCLFSQALDFPLNEHDFAALKESMMARTLPLLYEYPTTTPIAQFEASLRDFLPTIYPKKGPRRFGRAGRPLPAVPFSHHLIYFPPQTSLSELLPDSTDPAQSPGDPFDRRMWAGGSIDMFRAKGAFRLGALKDMNIDERDVCLERISDVQLKGTGESQKIFVTLERRIAPVPASTFSSIAAKKADPSRKLEAAIGVRLSHMTDPENVRQYMLKDGNHCAVIEKRNLVFMNNSTMPKPGAQPPKPPKILKAAQPADHSVTMVPTAALLFRFSALTFNAHRIHLDREYCRDVEGHRNLIVHGPLSCMLMCENLRAHLEREHRELSWRDFRTLRKTALDARANGRPEPEVISSLEYRNLAPIYADEEMRLCFRKKDSDENGSSYEVWVENAQGSMCVKGTARTSTWLPKDKEEAEFEVSDLVD